MCVCVCVCVRACVRECVRARACACVYMLIIMLHNVQIRDISVPDFSMDNKQSCPILL